MVWEVKYYDYFPWRYPQGMGMLSTGEQTLRLWGYTAARQSRWSWRVVGLILVFTSNPALKFFDSFLGLSANSSIISFALVGAIWITVWALVTNWPRSTAAEEFDKNLVTQIERREEKISFKVPNPMKPGKLLSIRFMAKSKDEAEQIQQALRKAQEG
jgi:hypothetical protein